MTPVFVHLLEFFYVMTIYEFAISDLVSLGVPDLDFADGAGDLLAFDLMDFVPKPIDT